MYVVWITGCVTCLLRSRLGRGRVHGAGIPSHRLPQKVLPMNSKKITVAALVAIVLVFFFLGMNAYQKRVQNSQAEKVSQVVQLSNLARQV